MRWKVHGERTVYDNEWIRLALVDVEVPGHGRIDHHVVRATAAAAGVVVHDPDHGLLLMWRHRFVPDTWGWEIPAGRIDEGETPAEAAAREVLEETGWRPGPLRPLLSYFPTAGLSDQRFHLFSSDSAEHVGEPSDPGEAERVEWVPVERALAAVEAGEISDGLSLTGLLYALRPDSRRP